MCDALKMLEQLKHMQLKPEPLYCTCSTNCWCNHISFRSPVEQAMEECMSPAELLEQYGDHMNGTDKKYLWFLTGREFIRD